MEMISNVSICNRAFTLLSVDRITALNDTSEQARKINAIFDDTRDAMLEEHNWNFAIKERTLSLLSETPVMDAWSLVYQLPSDCIRVIRLEGDYAYAIYGRKLYTNSDDPRIEYLSKETDPTKFSKGFVKALASRLAADLAFGMTQNATMAQQMDAVAVRDLKEAKWSDSQEGQGITIIRGSMVEGF
jgi:hypothetical protein